MKFVSDYALDKILKNIVGKINEKINPKVTSISTDSIGYITIDNTDPTNPMISLTQDAKDKLAKVDTLWNEVFNLVDRKVSMSAIIGVPAPEAGEIPPRMITECTEYSGSILWNPNVNPYTDETDFTATITLVAKSGFTFEGIPANFFTLSGATSITNDANSGVITVTFPRTGILVLPKEPIPSAVVDYVNEKITNLTPTGWCYTINGTEYCSDDPGTVPIQSGWFGQSISVVKNGNVNGEPPHTSNSDPQTLNILTRPAAPNGVSGGTNGDISGLSPTGMEYRKVGDSNWINITGTSLTNLTPAPYEIRFKSVSNKFASEIVTVVVTKEILPSGGWTMTSKIPLNIVVISGADGTVPLPNWDGYDGTQILTDELYDCPSIEEQKVRLYAKYPLDPDYKEVLFDNFGPGTVNGNSLKEWGYNSDNNSVYVVGSNATGGDVLLKLVKED